MHIDTVLYNGTIHTLDPQVPTVEAIALSGEQIAAIGTKDDLCTLLGPNGQSMDLDGKTVIPGLVDAHLHFAGYSQRLDQVHIHELPKDETLARVKERVLQSGPNKWLRGGGWNCNLWAGGAFPTRQDLDAVAPDNPVALSSKDGHSVWINTRAMQEAGIDANTADVPGGAIFRDASGMPTGILQENALGLVYDAIPRPTLNENISAIERGMDSAHRLGLTGVHDCEGAEALAAFQTLRRQGKLTMRVLMHIPRASVESAIQLGIHDGLGDPWIRFYGVKIFADGALGSRSAWMIAPYEDDPDSTGIPTITPQELNALVRQCNQAGLSVAIHAIGDGANRAVLDAIEQARDENTAHLRNRIEHVQLLHPNDIGRLAQLGVVASMQPIHATADIDIVDQYWGARGTGSYAWRSLLDAGTVLAFGSDAPVEDISPLVGIHAAVTRRRADGYPAPEGWYPEQRLTIHEALYAYTMGAAFASGEEKIKGSLVPGKVADLVVLDRDLYLIDPMEILEAQVVATMVGGKFVYQGQSL